MPKTQKHATPKTKTLPKTRYRGSKRKLVTQILSECQKHIPSFTSVLDVFGGTGVVSLYMKAHGKKVAYNDILRFNGVIGTVLLNATASDLPSLEEMENIFTVRKGVLYKSVISVNFKGIYFSDLENEQLDVSVQNLLKDMTDKDPNRVMRANVLMYLLIQSCLVKRPYNLFHRKNLYMRAVTEGTKHLANKKTWDRGFISYMTKFNEELKDILSTSCAVDIESDVTSYSYENIPDDYLQQSGIDTVYLDPPYFKTGKKNQEFVEYYHFLEGMVNYEQWEQWIDIKSRNKRFTKEQMQIYSIRCPHEMIALICEKYKDFNIVISYREGGCPSIEEIVTMLEKIGKSVFVKRIPYRYSLSKHAASSETIIVATTLI